MQLVEALRRTALMCKDEIDTIAFEEHCDDDPVGVLVEAFTRCLTLMLGFDSITAHRLALDAVSRAFLADLDE